MIINTSDKTENKSIIVSLSPMYMTTSRIIFYFNSNIAAKEISSNLLQSVSCERVVPR